MYLSVLILTEFGFELDDFLLQGWDSLPQPSDDRLVIQDLISTVNMRMKCGELLYKLFYFREFRESNPRENFHFNLCLFIALKTSENCKINPSWITAPSPKSRK